MPRLHQVLASPLIGGAGVLAIRLAASARDRQISCMAWVPGEGPASEALDREHVRYKTYHLDRMRGSALRQLIACGQMWRGLTGVTVRPPIVHVHNPVIYRLIRPALAAARARTVVHFHIESSDEEIRWALEFPPRHVVACARYIAAKIEQVLARQGVVVPVSAVPNAIDLDSFRQQPREAAKGRAGVPADRFVVLVLANLAPHKGQATAIRAMQLLKARGINAECWLAGEDRTGAGQYQADLRKMCADLGVLDTVRFLGFRTDIPDLFRAADVFVLPSTHEGLPLSILEAHASVVPVIASPIPGVLEVIDDGRTGFIVRPEDAGGYADRIQLLIERPDVRHQVVQAGLAQVTGRYGWSTFETRMFAIYRSLSPATTGEPSTSSG